MSDSGSFSINRSSLGGDGAFALKSFGLDEVVFAENPLYCQQTLNNKQDILACAQCHAFLGDINLQLDILLRIRDRQNVGDSLCCCSNSCGEFYCSHSCRHQHWTQSHQLLCTGDIPDELAADHPLIRFKTHAVETNEVFLLVADVFSQLISRHDSGLISIEQSLLLFRSYMHSIWWDVVTVPDDRDPVEFKHVLQTIASESYSLLSEALRLKEKRIDHLLSLDFMAR